MEATVLLVTNSEATYHHICHILFVNSKSQVQTTFVRWELHEGMNTWRQESLGAILETASVQGQDNFFFFEIYFIFWLFNPYSFL